VPRLGGLDPGSLEVPDGVPGVVVVPEPPVLGGSVVPSVVVVVPEGGDPLPPTGGVPDGSLVGGTSPVGVVVVPVLVPPVLDGGVLAVVPLLELAEPVLVLLTVGGGV
jgi:hypothetical protein